MSNAKVPQWISQHIGALLLATGVATGSGVMLGAQYVEASQTAQRNAYVQAVAADTGTSMAVKIAMVLASFYESSGELILTPYVDTLGRGQPLTVCNGITGAGVVAGKRYTPAECYALEKGRYLQAERDAQRLLVYWPSYDPFVQATFLDFLHNKGAAQFSTSTMRRLANEGKLEPACAQNPRWNKGTVNNVLTVLPGLQIRGNANGEICSLWRMPVGKGAAP